MLRKKIKKPKESEEKSFDRKKNSKPQTNVSSNKKETQSNTEEKITTKGRTGSRKR